MRCYTERNKETKIRNIQQFSEVKGYGKHCNRIREYLDGNGNRICNADLYLITDLTFWIYSKIRREDQKYREKPEPVKTEEPAAVVEEPQTQVVNLQKDEQLVAVITAAIMASYGSNAVSADKLVVRSIHRVDGRRA